MESVQHMAWSFLQRCFSHFTLNEVVVLQKSWHPGGIEPVVSPTLGGLHGHLGAGFSLSSSSTTSLSVKNIFFSMMRGN